MKIKLLFLSVIACVCSLHAQTTLSGFYPSSNSSGASFGSKTALHENTYVVSSSTFGTNPEKVFVFSKVNQVITQQAVLYPTDAVPTDQFGQSITVFGDYIAVGSSFHDADFADAGAVYIYKKIDNVWSFFQKITAFDAATNKKFGTCVKLQGTSLFVSAPNDQNTDNIGSVYFYSYNGTNWVFQQKLNSQFGINLGAKLEVQSNILVASDALDNFHTFTFGSSWTFSDSILNIGSLEYDIKDFVIDGNRLYITAVSPLNPTDNAVLIRNRVNNDWVGEPGIDVNYNDFVVGKIAVSGTHMLVGHENYFLQIERKYPVRFYKKISNNWVFQTLLYGEGPVNDDDRFGSAIALQDAEVLIGATDEGLLPFGKAYNYNLNLLSVPNFEKNSFSIYPNPTNDLISIENKTNTSIQKIELFSFNGQLLLKTSNDLNLSLENFQSGIYFLKITAENGTFETHKIIKK